MNPVHYKDSTLNKIAEEINVAQFVSFSPDLKQRYSRIFGYEANYSFPSLQDALKTILSCSSESSVNIRSFYPNSSKNQEFIYGIKDINEIEHSVIRLANRGLYTIVNETIDKCDGGVSGVLMGDVIEFAPDDTPRCVDDPEVASLPRHLGLRLLETVYGFTPALSSYSPNIRVEFSIHPLKRGFLHDHTIIWELEEVQWYSKAKFTWPNRFSRFIGDKVYGLLIAHILGLSVPETTVFSRRVAPFYFGQSTRSAEVWIRTCPSIQMPGKFSTYRGWQDPFQIMATEDWLYCLSNGIKNLLILNKIVGLPNSLKIFVINILRLITIEPLISSVIAQKSIEANYSGALIASKNWSINNCQEEIIIEGVQGFGDEFMVGRKSRSNLPDEISAAVKALYEEVASVLGAVRMEWVADSEKVWVVQLHYGSTNSLGNIIYPGKALSYHRFDVKCGLEKLRDLISSVNGQNEGIILVGDVGITSHFGDVLRRAKIPSIIALTSEEVDKVLRINEPLMAELANKKTGIP